MQNIETFASSLHANGTDPLSQRIRSIWTAGDFGRIAAGYANSARAFVEALNLEPGERVLDVACGTGNLAIPAARMGALVTGQDIAPNLLEQARMSARHERLAIQFDEGNCEHMPYADGTFDTVMTMYGSMFSPRPEQTAAEMIRVCRPGGQIAMANWTRSGFIGRMLRAHVDRVPPPAGVPSVLLWGDEDEVKTRLSPGVTHILFERRMTTFHYPFRPEGVVELFRAFYGPTVRTFEALDPEGRAGLYEDLVRLWTTHNRATDGTTLVDSEYLAVVAYVA